MIILILTIIFEILMTVLWQRHSKNHVVLISIILGAILPPTFYLMFICTKTKYSSVHPKRFIQRRHSRSWQHISISIFTQIVILVILSIIGVTIAAILMSATSAWCCVRQGRRLQLCDLAAAVAKVFNQNGIDYYVTFGSLLSYAKGRQEGNDQNEEEEEKNREKVEEEVGDGKRAGASNKEGEMIPWEHDEDLAIAEKQVEIAYKLLKERGFNMERRSSSETVAFRIHLPGANVWASAWAMTWIDVYPYKVEKKSGEIISSRSSRDYFGTKIMLNDVKPFRNISYCGFDSFSGPRLPIRHVKKKFGANWRKTVFPDNYRGTTCKIIKDC